MPTDSLADSDREWVRERDHDKGDRSEKHGSRQKVSASASKSKDLSHVPCKFYKVGGCTAGSSCPFSHQLPEPGQKETCAWFVKGNCKFGHKCALAHILPGQDLSMDRKNKKAAQQAAAASGGGDRGGKEGKGRGGKREGSGAPGGGTHTGKNSLLAGGSTAPTRILTTGASASSTTGRVPMNMPLKASISPSAPAPPLKDSDFASFASLDEMEGVQSSPDQSQGRPGEEGAQSDVNQGDHPSGDQSSASPAPLPPSAPRSSSTTVPHDFGPIGSPPNARSYLGDQKSPNRLNGNSAFSPGTSPRTASHLNGVNVSGSPNTNAGAALLSSSPFSAPGTQSSFRPASYSAALGLSSGIAASLGSGLTMMGGRKGWGDAPDGSTASVGAGGFSGLHSAQISSSVNQHRSSGLSASVTRADYDVTFEYDEYLGAKNLRRIPRDTAVEDGDLEDFIPGSLTDLLTPEERNRRMSRSNSGQPPSASSKAAPNTLKSDEGLDLTGAGNGSGLGHRYSRSVPAPSLLGDIQSIWSDTTAPPLPSSPPNNANATQRGTPSVSLTSRFEGLNVGGLDEGNLSMSLGTPSSIGMISPSNASAAFLPGFHQQYLAAKAKQGQQAQLGQGGLGRGLRGTSGPLFAANSAAGANNSLANTYLQPLGVGGLPSSPNNSTLHTHIHGNTQHTYRTTPSPFDLTQNLHQHRPLNARPIANNNGDQRDDPLLGPHILSPSTRALQSHAPGQSLPQGLAAGLSRIHALPPLSHVASPGTPGAFILGTSPGASIGLSSNAPYGDWQGTASPSHLPSAGHAAASMGGGSDHAASKLSYSAAASRTSTTTPLVPPGLTRNPSAGVYPAQPQRAPLGANGPSRDDDDELFSMDG